MKDKERQIYDHIIFLLHSRLNMLGMDKSTIHPDYDLLKTGLLDSMSFVNLVTAMEKKFNVSIDFELLFEAPEFSRVKELVKVFAANIK